jgi:hypothetical protein
MYADDNKMYTTINNLADALTLQENLNRLSSWCILNKLALNVSKCKVVSYSYKKSPLLFNYHIDNLILKRENTVKDLGTFMYFDERLHFNSHIDIAVNKAVSRLGFIIRNSRDFTNIEIFQLLFKTYVIPCMEYACLVFCKKPYQEWTIFISHIFCELFGNKEKETVLIFNNLYSSKLTDFIL